MNSGLTALAIAVVVALLAFSAAAWGHPQPDATIRDTAEPGLLLVIGVALTIAGLLPQAGRAPTPSTIEVENKQALVVSTDLAGGD